MESRIRDIQPDIFFILLDTFMLYPWLLEKNLRPAITGFYFPSDGGGFPLGCENILRYVDCPVAMATYGQEQVKKDHDITTEMIPHAVDVNLYRPLGKKEKEEVKEEMVVKGISGASIKGFLAGKFVVGVVARNQGRKMLDRTIKAFAKFCKDKPDAVLYFHSDPFDLAAPFDLTQEVRKHGIENRVCFSPMAYYENFPLKEMNKVYNCFDVFFLSTSGEGFGIPTIEAMACEVPVVITDYTTSRQLTDNGRAGLLVPLCGEIMGNWNVLRGVMDEDKAADALTELYNDKDLRALFGLNGREIVLRDFDWDKVIDQWDALFTKLIQRRDA